MKAKAKVVARGLVVKTGRTAFAVAAAVTCQTVSAKMRYLFPHIAPPSATLPYKVFPKKIEAHVTPAEFSTLARIPSCSLIHAIR